MAKHKKETSNVAAEPTLYACLVEDHHDALPFIHKAIRRGILPFSEITMVHFDAHPDLMAPKNAPLRLLRQPQQLYEALDESESGIAEWILPLIFCGHMSKVAWIRSPWSEQLPDGTITIHVGAANEDGRRNCLRRFSCPWSHLSTADVPADFLHVSSPAQYFLDDSLYCSEEGMRAKSAFQLMVAAQDSTGKLETLGATLCHFLESSPGRSDSAIVLDICLDYFSTLNPFLKVCYDECGARITEKLGQLQKMLKTRLGNMRLAPESAAVATCELNMFVQQLLRKTTLDLPESEFGSWSFVTLTTSKHGPSPGVDGIDDDLFTLLLEVCEEGKRLSQDQLETLRWAFSCLDLPHHESSQAELNHMLQQVEHLLISVLKDEHQPKLITISRSAEDGFIDESQALAVETSLRELLKRCYGPALIFTENVDDLKKANPLQK